MIRQIHFWYLRKKLGYPSVIEMEYLREQTKRWPRSHGSKAEKVAKTYCLYSHNSSQALRATAVHTGSTVERARQCIWKEWRRCRDLLRSARSS